MDLIYYPNSHEFGWGEQNVYEKQLRTVNPARTFNDDKELLFIIFRYDTGISIMCF